MVVKHDRHGSTNSTSLLTLTPEGAADGLSLSYTVPSSQQRESHTENLPSTEGCPHPSQHSSLRYSHHLGTGVEAFPSTLRHQTQKLAMKVNRIFNSPRSRWMPGTTELRKNMERTNPSTVRHLTSRLLSDILCYEKEKHNSFAQYMLWILEVYPQSYIIWITVSIFFKKKIEHQNLCEN